jgi:hypothetical protein
MSARKRKSASVYVSILCVYMCLSVCVCVCAFVFYNFILQGSKCTWVIMKIALQMFGVRLCLIHFHYFSFFFKNKNLNFSVFFLWWKMASLGNFLVTKILGHSAAEKAFRWGKKRFRILWLLLTFCPSLSCVHELNWKLIYY